MKMSIIRRSIFSAVLLAAALLATPARAADSLLWNTRSNTVTADIKNWNLSRLLAKISTLTGWPVILEPGTTATVTAKFKNASSDEALSHLLGNLNYAKDSTHGVPRLLVFRTAARAATQLIEPAPPDAPRDYRIPNELLVHLNRDASTNSIDDLAKAVGAKIIGRDDRLKLYRLQFADADAADAGSAQLAGDRLGWHGGFQLRRGTVRPRPKHSPDQRIRQPRPRGRPGALAQSQNPRQWRRHRPGGHRRPDAAGLQPVFPAAAHRCGPAQRAGRSTHPWAP